MSNDLRTLLDEWKALEAAATPRPWFADGGCLMHDVRYADIDYDHRESLLSGTGGVDVPGWCEHEADAQFIAASRTIVPRLIAAVEAVLTLAEAWRYKGEYGDGPWQLGEGPDESGQALDDASSQLRAAVRSALIGDDDDR